jgi:hypothetical protein
MIQIMTVSREELEAGEEKKYFPLRSLRDLRATRFKFGMILL